MKVSGSSAGDSSVADVNKASAKAAGAKADLVIAETKGGNLGPSGLEARLHGPMFNQGAAPNDLGLGHASGSTNNTITIGNLVIEEETEEGGSGNKSIKKNN